MKIKHTIEGKKRVTEKDSKVYKIKKNKKKTKIKIRTQRLLNRRLMKKKNKNKKENSKTFKQKTYENRKSVKIERAISYQRKRVSRI